MRCWERSRWVISAFIFPTAMRAWKGADSRALLRHVASLVAGLGWDIGNVDATVIAQVPRLAPFVAAMRANIAADLGCDPARVSVKATTTERLGFTGREEGIAAQAVVLLALQRTKPRSEAYGER